MKTPLYSDTPAHGLIGDLLLIVGYHPGAYSDMRVHARLKRNRKTSYVCFKAGVVIQQQLEQQRFFPVWARLRLREGKAHPYYILDLACTTEIKGGTTQHRWRVSYNPTTETWKGVTE
jgi:hypothetical protein